MLRYRASAEGGLLAAGVLKSLDNLPNYSRWSKALHEQDAVTYIFDGPRYAKGTRERIEKLKTGAK